MQNPAPSTPNAQRTAAPDDRSADDGVVRRVAQVIERLRPAVQADGGDLELVGVSHAGMVRVRLHGACVGCPSSMMTLKTGVERNLRELIPEVSGVEAVA